ncbi:hypothetical protein Sango_1135000 [Sesamum angolense]|uniref:DUF1664 domain-containing protein n=1 Tax=Sesamum angolense TaxID=2727404 RepID=A0AAE1WW28_9LAMI|nr:hypothetical protein Sango_1135000 [Sesamum angolense]
MAMQAGIGLSRIVLIVGAGYTGTVLLKNGKLSDVLGELQNLVKGMEKTGENEGDSDFSDAIAAQVRRLSMEVRQLASSRQITVLNGSSGQSNLTSLVVPAAALGALGYGYMWWKGLSFSDLMYVTKRNMANAVSNLTKHLDHVSEALAATKRHLTQRIENLDGKLDEQVEISKLIRNEVNDVRGDLSQIGFDLDELQRMVSGLPILNTSLKAAPILKYLNQDIHVLHNLPPLSHLIFGLQDGKLLTLEGKQELANAGVMYLCSIVNGRKVKMPEMLQDQLKIAGNSLPSLMGLKEIADSGSSGNKLLTDGNTQDGSNKMNKTLMSSSVYSQTDVFSMRVVYFSV